MSGSEELMLSGDGSVVGYVCTVCSMQGGEWKVNGARQWDVFRWKNVI